MGFNSPYSQELPLVRKQIKENQPVPLTPKEVEVLKLICQQMTNEEIAKELSISTRTVTSHRHNIMVKLRVNNVIGLAQYAIKEKIVEW